MEKKKKTVDGIHDQLKSLSASEWFRRQNSSKLEALDFINDIRNGIINKIKEKKEKGYEENVWRKLIVE